MPSPAVRTAAPLAAPARATRPASGSPRRRGALRGLAVLTLGAAACKGGVDPFAPRASLETTLDTLVVYPLRNPQPLLPAALDLYGAAAVRPGLRAGIVPNFDIAFDTDAQGRVLLYPARVIASPPGGSPRTGLQVVTTAFDALTSAPREGYRFDSLQVVSVGQTVAVEGQGVSASGLVCVSSTLPLRAKLVVDSVARATGAIHLRVRTNPNCGFRSLEAGLPKD